MTNSKQLAGLIGPTIIAITISETLNVHIWVDNTAAGVHLMALYYLLPVFQLSARIIIGFAVGQ